MGGALALFLLWTWISGCATLNPGPRRENFAPLFIYSEDEEREGKALDVLGPFFSYRKDQKEQDLAFRPLLLPQEGAAAYLSRIPLPPREIRADRPARTLLPHPFLFHPPGFDPGASGKERTSFLLAIWGETGQGEKYGGFFPFYGHLKKRFGKDEINFVLWPLYSDSRAGRRERPTPFSGRSFPITEGEGKGCKIWPLAGHETRRRTITRKPFSSGPFFTLKSVISTPTIPRDQHGLFPSTYP